MMLSEKQRAERYHRQSDFQSARSCYELHLAQCPEDSEGWHALGVLLAQCDENVTALTHIQKAIALKTQQANYYNSLGNVLMRLKDYDAAVNAYQKAIKINPHYAIAYNNLGNVFYQLKKNVSAEKAYQKAIQIQPTYSDAHMNLGILLAHLERHNEAIQPLKKALALKPNLLPALNQLAEIYLMQGEAASAIPLFLQRIALLPDNIDTHFHLGLAYAQIAEYEKAIHILETVLSLNHRYPEIHQTLANLFLQMGESEKALSLYLRQLQFSPLQTTHYNIGVLLMDKNRLKEALYYFAQAERMDPDDLSVQLNMGAIYLKQNNNDAAIVCYKNAARIRPDDPEIQHILTALTQNYLPDKPPSIYVSHLFDHYANHYDQHLTKYLEYTAPKQLLSALTEERDLESAKWKILDLGCGTGLAGEVFKSFSEQLIGIDLSQKMLAIAREKNMYDQLIHQDITIALQNFSNIDLIIAADVLTYLGELSALFYAIKNALSPHGLFAFTLEKTTQKDFILQSSIRYAHHAEYIKRSAEQAGLSMIRLNNIKLRKEHSTFVEGYLVILSLTGRN